jgi:hypothetical protein
MIANLFHFCFLLFLFASISGCSIYGTSQTDWIWKQMNEQQKQNALDNYRFQYCPSQPNTSPTTHQPTVEMEAMTALREELIKLKMENARLQEKLRQNKQTEGTVVFMPPAF